MVKCISIVHVYCIFIIHSLWVDSSTVDGELGEFHVLATVNRHGLSMDVKYVCDWWILKFFLVLLRNLQTAFHSGCIVFFIKLSVLLMYVYVRSIAKVIEVKSPQLYFTITVTGVNNYFLISRHLCRKMSRM